MRLLNAYLLSAIATLGLNACGNAPYSVDGSSRIQDFITGTSTGSGSGSSTTGQAPIIIQRADIVGYNSYSFTVYTNQKLRIRVAPGMQDRMIAGTGASPQYSRMYSRISVSPAAPNNTGVMTPVLSNGLLSTAQTYTLPSMDDAFVHTCAATNTTCRQAVTITVSQPNYDYWWTNGYYVYPSNTPYVTPGQQIPEFTHVYPTHPVNETLYVQTDDTVALQ